MSENNTNIPTERIHSELRRIGMEYMETMAVKPVRNIYVDASVFHDCHIGAVLQCVKDNEDAFKYAIDQIPVYLSSWDNQNILKYVPKLGITVERFSEVLNDPALKEFITVGSPLLTTYIMLLEIVDKIIATNRVRPGVNTPTPVTLTISTTDFHYSKAGQDRLANRIHVTCPDVTIVFVETPIHKMPITMARVYDLLLVRDMVAFLDEKNPTAELIAKDKRWKDSFILTPYHTDPALPRVTTEVGRKEVIKMTELSMGFLCNFKFVGRELIKME